MRTVQTVFYYPINLHYSQTGDAPYYGCSEFYYPINLHYSQTFAQSFVSRSSFYYPINLHYSQTAVHRSPRHTQFYYPINLHYSQTRLADGTDTARVLLPYKFTLLSNRCPVSSVYTLSRLCILRACGSCHISNKLLT